MFAELMGGMSVLGGLYSSYQQSQAQKSGEALMDKQLNIAQQQVNLSEQQMQQQQYRYNQFQNLYGDIEQNMASYYKNLSPDVYTSQMNEAISTQFNKASTQLRQNLASRNIQGSGVEAGAQADLYAQKANAEAKASANADSWVNQQQSNFMQGQYGRMDQANANVMNAGANAINSMGAMSNVYGNMASNQFNLAGQYGQSAVAGIGQGMYGLGFNPSKGGVASMQGSDRYTQGLQSLPIETGGYSPLGR